MSSVTSDTSLEQTARVITLCFLFFLSIAAAADSLTGKVVKVAGGDTITVLDNTNTRAAPPAMQNDRLRSRLRRDLEKDGSWVRSELQRF